MRRYFACLLFMITISAAFAIRKPGLNVARFYKAGNAYIQYVGRIDFTNPQLPRIWVAGAYVNARFKGTFCKIVINDEVLWNKNHNYLEVIVDGKDPVRIQTTKKTDTITLAAGLNNGMHTFTLCKDTESNIGYIEVAGLICDQLLPPPPLPQRKMEFIGNSITCGAGMDQSAVPCHTGLWQDQHNAYMAYGPRTARLLNAQWHLTSVSGIGLMHSCCNLDMVMGQVFDKIDMRTNAIKWDFSLYQPDVVTICLGQNDGVQDSARFVTNYIGFVKNVRLHYANSNIVCLTSPMANDTLKTFLTKSLKAVVTELNNTGDKKVSYYVFKQWYHNGCDYHPDMDEHRQIADELTMYIKTLKHW